MDAISSFIQLPSVNSIMTLHQYFNNWCCFISCEEQLAIDHTTLNKFVFERVKNTFTLQKIPRLAQL